MLSPDDCCSNSEDVEQQVSAHGKFEKPSENSQEAMVIEEDLMKCPADTGIKNYDRKAGQGSSSKLEINKKEMTKVGAVSKQLRKHDKRKTNIMYRSGNKGKQRKPMCRQKMYSYICTLQNTVKKQQNIIRNLNLKLKKHGCDSEKQCVQNKSLVSNTGTLRNAPDNATQGAKNNESDKLHNTDLSSQKSLRNTNYSFCDILSENVGDHKKNADVQLSLSENRENLSKDRENLKKSSSSEQFVCKDNREVQGIESDSKVHLHSDEMKGKNSDTDEFDEEVKKCIEEFMVREDVSVTDLSVKLQAGEKITRFRRHFLSILYKQFHAEVNSRCNLSQFRKHIPTNVLKPSPTYWKVLKCSRCENTELKFMEITSKVLLRKDLSLEEVLARQDLYENVSRELGKLKYSQNPFTYTTWARTLLGKMEASEKIVTTTVGSACTDILKELDMLKEHLIRCFQQYEAVREAREETEISPIHAMVHIDWYESPATFVARHLHTSYYYGDGFKTLHAGYVRTKAKSYGFASLSDCRDHTAPAVWASINDILVGLAKEGMKVITVVSDSATAQYRNKGNFYLMRRFAKQNNVEMKWIYLEGGHGRGIADAIGSSIKQIMCDTINHHPNKSFRNTMDILPIIKDLTPIKLFTHTEHLVQQYKNLLARQHLQVVPRTYKIHEVCVKETSFYVKESSADTLPFFSLESLDTWVKGSAA